MNKGREEEELKECTFKPQMKSKTAAQQTRSKQEFIESQEKFIKVREEKIKKA